MVRLVLGGGGAGVLYALVDRKSGRLGDAVAAHCITNLLLFLGFAIQGDATPWISPGS